MILPLRGEATLKVGPKGHRDWVEVIGVDDEGDLLLSRQVSYKIGDKFEAAHEIQWASDVGKVIDFTPADRQIIPAAPGFVARAVSMKDGEIISVEHLSIVGWALPTAAADGEPIVVESVEGNGVSLLSKCMAHESSNTAIDAIYFAPTANSDPPEIDIEYVKSMVD